MVYLDNHIGEIQRVVFTFILLFAVHDINQLITKDVLNKTLIKISQI